MADYPAPGQDPAERAFEHLRAEVTIMRRAVEELRNAVEENAPADYDEALAQIVQGNGIIAKHIQRLADHTAVHLPPDQYEREMARAAVHGFRPAHEAIARAESAMTQAAERLSAAHGRIRTRLEQREKVQRAAAIGAGIALLAVPLLLLPLASALPTSWSVPERLAAGVVGEDRWNAGQQLMASGDPDGWHYVQEGWRLRAAGGDKLRDCLTRAEKSGKPERCTVTLKPAR